MVLDSLLPRADSYHSYGGRDCEENILDKFCGILAPTGAENVEHVYVGPNRGRYEESTRGNFHYVGPGRGHYDKEQLPPDYSAQNCARYACLAVLLAVVFVVAHAFAKQDLYDCADGVENWTLGWSSMKKEYCCSTARLGCADTPADIGTQNPLVSRSPAWLSEWLPDLDLGAKFVLTLVFMCILGFALGASILYFWTRYFARRTRSKTELEAVSELNQLLDKAGAARSDPQISLMWDTLDDFDLILDAPCSMTVHSGNPETAGFRLDVDANTSFLQARRKTTAKPVENIFMCMEEGQLPVRGDYAVRVKVMEKHDHTKTANLTCAVTVDGKRDVYHHRVLPGVSEVKICNFTLS